MNWSLLCNSFVKIVQLNSPFLWTQNIVLQRDSTVFCFLVLALKESVLKANMINFDYHVILLRDLLDV